METLYCGGCGTPIQTADPYQIGYTPESALNRSDVLCQRCFRLRHYNEPANISVSDADYSAMLDNIQQKNGLIVHVVDIFDLNGTLMNNLKRVAGDNPILFAANKIDLMPKSTNRRKLEEWIRSTVKDWGIRTKDVCLISSKNGEGLERLKRSIDQHRNHNDVYVVGITNTGKSTLINRLIKETTHEEDVITTSYFPGTTLGFIEIPLDDTRVLVDTPGILNPRQITHYLSPSDLKQITPNKEIKARIYQLNQNQTLFFGGLARIDIIKGDRSSVVCFFANDIPIHRTKLGNADELYDNHNGGLLSPPDEDSRQQLPPLQEHTFKITSDKTDIVFAGLGWVSIPHGNVTIRTHYPNGLSTSLRTSIL